MSEDNKQGTTDAGNCKFYRTQHNFIGHVPCVPAHKQISQPCVKYVLRSNTGIGTGKNNCVWSLGVCKLRSTIGTET